MRKIVQLIFLAGFLLLPILTLGETGLEPLSLSILLENDTVDVSLGESVIANVTAKGGTPPYTYDFDWFVDELDDNYLSYWVDYVRDATIPNASFMPPYGERGEVYAVVYDTTGERADAQASFVITGAPEPLACTIKFDKSVVNVNEEIAADVQITGGVEPYFITYSWRIIEADGNEISYDGWWVGSSWVPRLGNRGYLYVIVKDDVGRKKIFSSEQFEILGAPLIDAFVCSAVLDKQTIHVGETITAEWYASGGTPPYQFNYEWLILEQNGNETRIAEEYMQTTRASCTPKFGMEGTFRLTAMDALGREVVCEPNQFSITGAEETASITCTMKIDKTMIKPFYLSSWQADDSFPDETVSVTWNVDGGEAPYTYDLFCVSQYHGAINKTCPALEVDPVAQEGSHMLFAGNLETEGYFKLTVTDAKGRVNEFKSETFYVDWSNPAGGPGDTNTTGGIDILDLVSIIDFIVSDKAPKSFTNADANGDGAIDILDLVWIIDQIVGG